MSLIYLYEARQSKTGLCTGVRILTIVARSSRRFPASFLNRTISRLVHPPAGGPVPFGTLQTELSTNYRRNHFFGITGTYYDKDLTDIVYRYDAVYAPKVGIGQGALHQVSPITTGSLNLGTARAHGRRKRASSSQAIGRLTFRGFPSSTRSSRPSTSTPVSRFAAECHPERLKRSG